MDDQRETRAIRRRGFLPSRVALQPLIVDGAAIGLIGAMMIAATGATPPFAVIIVAFTIAFFCSRVALYRQPAVRAEPGPPGRLHPGPPRSAQPGYLTVDGLDGPSRVLLGRVKDAVDVITSSQVCQDGLVDRAGMSMALADQQRDIAAALREQARLRARRDELPVISAGPMTDAIRDSQAQAARLSESSLAARVNALERYAAEIREADAAYQDWKHAARLSELDGKHLDMLARTAADEQGIAEIETMSLQARAVRLALREHPA
jgi:hypothetical protein